MMMQQEDFDQLTKEFIKENYIDLDKEDTKERLERKQERFEGDLEPVLEAETYAEDEHTTKKTKT